MPTQKYYVVWKGRRTGIFASWAECEAAIHGYPGAQYRSYGSRREAEQALAGGYVPGQRQPASQGWLFAATKPVIPSVCVDAACSGSPGVLEYQGMITEDARPIFKEGPFQNGTNNVGEFLAIVQGMQWLDERDSPWPVYSDSRNAIGWVRQKKCNTRLARLPSNRQLFERIAAAERALRRLGERHVLKWDTTAWGEIPADFGRK